MWCSANKIKPVVYQTIQCTNHGKQQSSTGNLHVYTCCVGIFAQVLDCIPLPHLISYYQLNFPTLKINTFFRDVETVELGIKGDDQ